MNNKKNKGVLILIIILLIVFSSLAIWGGVANYLGVNKPKDPENVNREFKFNNKLYFYDMLNLIGTYDCKSNNCDYVDSFVDDVDYSLKHYKNEKQDKISLISKRFAFIIDDSKEILLYDVVNSSIINKYKAVKNYGIGIKDNYYIVKDLNNKWGVIKLDSSSNLVIDYKYEFIGLHSEIDEETKLINNEIFVVKDVNGWKLIDKNDNSKSTYFINSIYDYNDKFVITNNGNYYYINNADSGTLISSNLFLSANFINNYIAVLNSSKEFYILNPITLQEVSARYPVSSIEDVNLEETENGISITVNNIFKEIVK